jgi:phospholipase/carboxylesterase
MAPLSAAWRAHFPGASFMVPDAPDACRGGFWRRRGRQWFSLEPPRAQQMAAAAAAARGLNLRVDAELKRLGLPPGDVVYCGFSQGAMVSLLAGLMCDAAPRGIVSMAGSLLAPEDGFVARGRPPVLLVHGAEDRVVPASRSEEAAVRLRAAGIRVQLEILPLLGHMIVPDAAPFAADFIAGLGA